MLGDLFIWVVAIGLALAVWQAWWHIVGRISGTGKRRR